MNNEILSEKIHISILENDKDFLSIKADWDRLAQELTPENNFEWMHKWWIHFKKDKKLKIILAHKKNKLVGIAPLYLDNGRALKFLKFKKLCFLGGSISDYSDFLIEQGAEQELIFRSLLNYALGNISYDILELKQINSFLPNFHLWQRYAEQIDSNFTPFVKCHKIDISKFKSYQDYTDQLSCNLKDQLRKGLNRAKKDFANVEFVFTNNITKTDISDIANLNINRQTDKFKKGDYKRVCYFLNNKKSNFIYDFFCNQGSDSKMLACLKFNSKIITYHLLLPNNSTLSLWNTAFDSSYHKYNPAKLLINEIIKYAFENNYKTLDFMRGDDAHKLKWTNNFSINYNLIKKKSFKAKLVFLYRENLPEFLRKKYISSDLNLANKGYII